MKQTFNLLIIGVILMFTASSCLYSGLEELQNSSDKELMAVTYTYRFLYNDTIKKGTPNEDIQTGRVCEVIFNQHSEKIEVDGLPGFKTILTFDINSIQKAGPTGCVTKEMLFNDFKKSIEKDGLNKLWVYVAISNAASLSPVNGAPALGAPGDFSTDRIYRVTAADGSAQDYILKTIKDF